MAARWPGRARNWRGAHVARLVVLLVGGGLIATACGGSGAEPTEAQTSATVRDLRVPAAEEEPEGEEIDVVIEGEPDDADDKPAASTTSLLPDRLAATIDRTTDVALNDEMALDVYAPVAAGEWPVVVMFPGRGVEKTAYSLAAATVADRGAVVFVANWRSHSLPPDPLIDTGCAIDTAIATASQHGGDPSSLTVVGYAFGVVPAVGLAYQGPWSAQEYERDCQAEEAPPVRIDTFVGVIGDYGSFDGLDENDEQYLTLSPFSQLDESAASPRAVLIHGVPDEIATELAETERFGDALDQAGHSYELVAVDAPNLSLIGLAFDDEIEGLRLLDESEDAAAMEAVADAIVAAIEEGPSR